MEGTVAVYAGREVELEKEVKANTDVKSKHVHGLENNNSESVRKRWAYACTLPYKSMRAHTYT